MNISEIEDIPISEKQEEPVISLDEILKNFPFENIRENQKEALFQVHKHMQNPKIKFFILQGFVGSGKSAIGIALARYFKSFIMTSNKMLQDQYLRDFSKYIADLRGRSNYMCHNYKGKNCAISPLRTTPAGRSQCRKKRDCEYYKALDNAVNSNIVSLNFAAAIGFLNYTNNFSNRDLTIIDEAHLIQDNLTNFIEFTINDTNLKAYEILTPDEDIPNYETAGEYAEWVNRLKNIAKDIAEKWTQPSNLDMARGFNPTHDQIENLSRKFQLISEQLVFDPDNFVLEKSLYNNGNIEKISLKPLDVSKYAKEKLFNFSSRVLLMSATIIDYEQFIKSVGIEPEEAVFIDLPHVFPVENRPFIRNYVDKFNYNNIDKNIPRIIKEIKVILENHANEKGMIHTNSYKIAQGIYQGMPEHVNRLVFPRSSREQAACITHHSVSTEPTVLISPSMTEGLDLKDDLARFQIIVKVPYPSLGDKVVKARLDRNPAWYSWRTLLTIIQAYGRSTRSETDYSVTYILDGEFEKLYNRCKKSLPKWFTEAIV